MAKIKNVEAWGRETARARYSGKTGTVTTGLMDQTSEEAPQDAMEKRLEPEYSNIASGWVRGAVGKPTMKDETAENKPGFDKNSRTGKL